MLSHATKHVKLDMSHMSLNDSKIENMKEGDEMSFFRINSDDELESHE